MKKHRNIIKCLVAIGAVLLVAATVLLAQAIVLYDGMPLEYSLPWGPRLTDARLLNGKLELHYRKASLVYCEDGFPPDEVWKDVYCASNGVIVFDRRVQGKVIPESTTPERVEWPEK